LDDLGRFSARIDVTLSGLSAICLATLDAAEVMVVTKKTWMT
jgi:hypothetical protein